VGGARPGVQVHHLRPDGAAALRVDRGTSAHRAVGRAYSGSRGRLPTGKPSSAARKAARTLPVGGTVIDVGAGRGIDASGWPARNLPCAPTTTCPPRHRPYGRPPTARVWTSTCDCSTSTVAHPVRGGAQMAGSRDRG
jgi:hypothetical protein